MAWAASSRRSSASKSSAASSPPSAWPRGSPPMFAQLRPAIVSTLFFTLLLGVGYPLAVTGLAHFTMPAQAEGSLVRDGHGQVIGSSLIAQGFARPEYLHPRP